MKAIVHQNRGFALLSVLFIITAISLMLGMLTQIAGQRAFTAKKLANQVKALAYAEAGVDYAYSILSQDFSQRNNSALSTETSYAEGSYTLTLTPVSNKYVVINSVGKCGDAVKVAEILVDDENAGSGGVIDPTDYSSMEGFNYAVLSGGDFNFGGSGSVLGAKLHSNSALTIRGDADANIDISSSVKIKTGNVTVEGSLTALDVDTHPKADILGGYTETSVPPVGIPDIDLTPYLSWAKRNGEVHNGFSTSSSYTPAGGVLWVNGDVTIDSHAVINGSIIATGNIYISGDVDIDPTTTTFAMASRDGNIINTSSGTLNGLIYAKTGNYSQTANGILNGQLMVNGTIKKGGNSDIINYVRSVPTPPGLPGSITPTTAWPVVSAWQK
jgi:cytoskeletal protein CcmA (bactofilin family)